MPFVSVTLPKGKDHAFIQSLSALVHTAMIETINCPPATLYHLINVVDPECFIYHPEYKGLLRTQNVILLRITLKTGRTPEQKKAMYERITQDLHTKLGFRCEDIFIILTENSADDWYFGRRGE